MKLKTDDKEGLKLTKQQEKFFNIVGCCIAGLSLLFLVIYGIDFNTSLSQNGKTTKGVVIKVDKGKSSKAGFNYEYIVNNKKYIGHTSLACMPYKIELGDTIDIRYDSIRPNRSIPVDNDPW